MPKKIVDGINIRDTVARVITQDGEADFFEVIAGVCEETLLPLFSLLLH